MLYVILATCVDDHGWRVVSSTAKKKHTQNKARHLTFADLVESCKTQLAFYCPVFVECTSGNEKAVLIVKDMVLNADT